MKLAALIRTAMATIVLVTGADASAGDKTGKYKPSEDKVVTVYFDNGMAVRSGVEGPAIALASKMFSDIGVRLQWRRGQPSKPQAGSVIVEFVTDTPAALKPGALAYAFPYEGVHIRIFADRISEYANPRAVLAHVMVHEITHILQGEARHSAEGIMKAKWTKADLVAMAVKPLSFTDEDVALIYRGLGNRAGHLDAGPVTPGMLTTTVAVRIEGQ